MRQASRYSRPRGTNLHGRRKDCKGAPRLSSIVLVSLLVAVACSPPSCRFPKPGLAPQERLAPDVVASVDLDPARLKRIGVLPFQEGEGPPWDEDFKGDFAEVVELDPAERFSELISRPADFEVVPPEKIASLLPRDTIEVTTRKQAADLCRDLKLDAVFRGRLGMAAERASIGSGEVVIPFAFVTLEVELLDSRSGDIVWFANHHLNSFQFLEDELRVNMDNPVSTQELIAERIPGYPDVISTLAIFAELAIAEVAESFAKSCSAAENRQ